MVLKVLFVSTHANQGTGYGRSSNKITNFLANHVEVVFLAFQNYPNQGIEDRFIDPRIRFIDAFKEDPESPKGFGDKCIKSSFDKEKPDILFLYNDLPVCEAILKMIGETKCKIVLYLDIVYPWEDIYRYEYLKNRVDMCLVFLDCWTRHLIDDLGWPPGKVETFKLGFDSDKFKQEAEAKKEIGFKSDDFIVLNLNRNSYRKQWNITIKAFIHFLAMNNYHPSIKLLCGCLLKTDDGYDILQLIDIECMKLKINSEIIKNNHIFTTYKTLHAPDEYINLIYNASDVGLNTCCGEGFGLTNTEHATFGKHQIVSGVPAIKETLGKFSCATIIEPKMWTSMSRFENHGGDIALFDYHDFALALNEYYHTGRNKTDVIEVPNFPWNLDQLIKHVCTI